MFSKLELATPVRLQNHGQRSVGLMICYKRVITMNDYSDFNRYHI